MIAQPVRRRRWWRWTAVVAVMLVVGGSAMPARPSWIQPEMAAAEPDPTSSLILVPRPDRDVSWYWVAGIALPVSQTAGPQCFSVTRASCFAPTKEGAAIAAVHLLVHTFPAAGSAVFEPTITEQISGPGAKALLQQARQGSRYVATGAKGLQEMAESPGRGWAVGYGFDTDHQVAGTTTVTVLLAQESGFVSYSLRLKRSGTDWKLIAPSDGNWRSSAQAATARDVHRFRPYDDLGVGPGGAT